VAGYQIEQRLGEGSFGVVWLARREEGHGLVAIKIPRQARMLEFPALRESFDREIDAALRAPRHPNVLLAHESATALLTDGSTVPALVTEYVAGARSLLEAADDRQLDSEARLELFMGAARGVAELQKYGSIHTDLKPQNILVGRDGLPRVADFGGLRLLADNDTAPAQISYRYAAPEVFDDRPETLDHRTVVYSLGKILLELLAGSDAVVLDLYHNRQEAAALIREWHPPDCRQALGAGWAGVLREIERATSADHSARHPNAEALVDALQRASVSPWRRAGRHVIELAEEIPTWVRLTCVALLLVLLSAAAAVGAGQLVAWHGQLGPGRYPKIVLPLPPDDGLQHVAIVNISSRDEALAFAAKHELSGVTAQRATWRSIWAEVAGELAQCQPKALAFDILFRRNDAAAEHTERLAREIRRLNEEEGLPAVVAISPTWDPSPRDSLLDPGIAAATAPQRAGAAEFDRGDCGGRFTVALSLVPSDPVESATSLSLAAVAAALSAGSQSSVDATRGCQISLDSRAGLIELRAPRRGGRVRVDRCETLKSLDSSSRQGARRQAESLPEGWTRDGVVAAIRYFAWPDLAAMQAHTFSIEQAVDLATSDPGRFRNRVIIFSNNAPDADGGTDSTTCGEHTLPNAWFHAQAIESMLDEIALDLRSASRLPIGGPGHVVALLTVAGVGILAGFGAGRIARRTLKPSHPDRAPGRRKRWWLRHTGAACAMLIVAIATAALAAAAWLNLVVPLHYAEFFMTCFIALASGLFWALWPRRGPGAAARPRALRPASSLSTLLLLFAVGLPQVCLESGGAGAAAASALVDGANAATGPNDPPGAGASPAAPPAHVVTPASAAQQASDDPPIEASLRGLIGNFPNRQFLRQWYTKTAAGALPKRRQTNFAVQSGKAELNRSTGLVEITPDAASGAAMAYFSTSLGPTLLQAPTDEKLLTPVEHAVGPYAAWWFPWVGQGPVQGASEGTQIAVASRAGTPAPDDPPGSSVELVRFYLVGPNAGSRVQLFDVSGSRPRPLLAAKGMEGSGFPDLVVEVRILRLSGGSSTVSVGAGPKTVSAAETPEEYKELAALKAFAVSNGLRAPE
jgi:serine/threonine protein kinase